MARRQVGDRAVVLGASLSGLFAAQVLSEFYRDVVLVDRDELPADHAPRRGVPHGRHNHGLLTGGQRALEELFPGCTADLATAGVPVGDLLADVRFHAGPHLLRQATGGMALVSASRPFLEGYVRGRVRALPNVAFRPRCDVVDVASARGREGQARITGVRLVARTTDAGAEGLPADLVVDATGRGSRTPTWLTSLGLPAPVQQRLRVDLGYASRTYRRSGVDLGTDLAVVQAPSADQPRGGVVAALEGDRCMLTLAGYLGDHPPTDPEGFTAFARSLPALHGVVRHADPLDDPVAFRFPASVRMRYERLHRFPDGLVVLGDAVCSFNPVYAQGMTVAAQQALVLRRHLDRGAPPRATRFFRDIARVVDPAWEMVVGGDLALPGIEGPLTRKIRLVNAYVARLQAAAAHDAHLAEAFVRVMALVDGPTRLLRPRVAWRVLRPPRRPPTPEPVPDPAGGRAERWRAGRGAQ